MFRIKAMLPRQLLLLILLPLFYLTPLQAQEISTLNNMVRASWSAADSAAIVGLIGKSQEWIYRDPAQAIQLVDSAIAISREKNFPYGMGNAYIAYAAYALGAGNYPLSDSFLRIAYPYCAQVSRESATNNLIVLWFQNSSNLAAYTGDYDKAVAFSFRALHLLEEKAADTAFVNLRITLYNDIGSMLQYLKQPDKAIDYLTEGLELAKTKNQDKQLASLYVNFGNAWRQKKNWEKSHHYLNKAITLAGENQNEFVLQVAYLSLANGYVTRDLPDSAIYWLKKTTKLSGKFNPYMSQVMPNITLGNIFLDKQDFRQAVLYGEKALKQATALQAPQTIAMAHEVLSKAYRAQGDWQTAFYHQENYQSINDSLKTAKKLLDINQLEVKYRVAKKDQRLTEQALLLSRQKSTLKEKNLWIIGTTMAGTLALLSLILLRKNYLHKQKRLTGEMQLAGMKAMLEGEEQERARIARELHDGIVSQLLVVKLNLSTTMRNALQEPVDPAELQESVNLLTEAMQDLRATSHNLTNESFLRLGFRDALAAFCDKINHSGALHVTFQAYGRPPEKTDNKFLLSIFRIIQELTQNVLKHAGAQTLLIQLNFQPDLLGITIQDDGQGFSWKDAVRTGSGLTNLQNRVKSLNGGWELSSDETGTSIYLEFPDLYTFA